MTNSPRRVACVYLPLVRTSETHMQKYLLRPYSEYMSYHLRYSNTFTQIGSQLQREPHRQPAHHSGLHAHL